MNQIEQLRKELHDAITSSLAEKRERVGQLSTALEEARTELRALEKEAKALMPDAPPVGEHECDQCDRSFPTKQGLGMHVTRSHKKPERSASPAPAPVYVDRSDPEGRLACQCGKRFDTATHLAAHTEHVHGRPPTRDERTPAA